MSSKSNLELKLGLFVLIGIIILAFAVFSIRELKSWQTGYEIFIRFNFLNGVKVGAPVRFRGVDVGEVRKVQILYDPQTLDSYAEVCCWIKNSIQIPKDSQVWINTLGILGEKYIEIMPGKENVFLLPKTIIKGNEPVAMHEVVELTRRLANNIEAEITQLKKQENTLGKLLYDDKLYKKLESILDDLKDLSGELKAHPWKLFYRPKEPKGKKK